MNQTLCLGGMSPSQLGRERASPVQRPNGTGSGLVAGEVRGRGGAEGQRLWGLGPLGSLPCAKALAAPWGEVLPRKDSAWLDPGLGGGMGGNPSLTQAVAGGGVAVGELSHLSALLGGPA